MSEYTPSEEADRQMWEHQTVAALIVKARKLGSIGVQFDDGHNYLVPAEKLVDYATVLNACADALEASERDRDDLRADAIDEAAQDWLHGGWADTPRRPDRVADRMAASRFAAEWLKARAARIRAGVA